MVNRLLYTYKFTSSKLKACDWNIQTTFQEAHELGEIISLADSQMLRLIRRLRKRTFDREKLEKLYAERDLLRKRCEKRKNTPWLAERLKQVQEKIYRTSFVPDYCTVVMESNSDYKKIYHNGFVINEVRYKRLSCSAGQARVSTVVFAAEDLVPKLKRIIENDRNPKKKIAPSKFNAYFGLSTSATFQVTEPRICVVPDYNEIAHFRANFDTETDWDLDDDIEEKEIDMPMNRFDGQGLISPGFAKKWSEDLGLDYIPSGFVIRHSFIKGLAAVFDFELWCKEKNQGRYLVKTVHKDENGNYIYADLREVDIIISESQFKLWDSWSSLEDYTKCCHKNKLTWGVAQYTPKKSKDILTLNYQFLQTLDLNKEKVIELCETFVDWLKGVSFENRGYMLLFLLGENNTKESIQTFLASSENWWAKCLCVASVIGSQIWERQPRS